LEGWVSVLNHFISKASVIHDKSKIRRVKTIAYLKASTRFPILKRVPRAESKKYRTTFKAHRPSTAQYRAVVKDTKA